jgi:hypothetical protein
MTKKHLVAVTAAALIAIGFSVTAADARKRLPTGYPSANSDIPSLDGRVLGYPRTCWSETYQYDSSGTPTGPYCH